MNIIIRKNYSISSDLFNLSMVTDAIYDIGEAKKIFQKNIIRHISSFENDKKKADYYFNFFTKPPRKTKKTLLYINSTSLEETKFDEETYYFIKFQSADVTAKLSRILEQSSIRPFDYLKLFKKSHLNEWKIIITKPTNLTSDCCVLNSFLSLGASFQSSPEFNQDPIMTFDLSFQHGIYLYEGRKK